MAADAQTHVEMLLTAEDLATPMITASQRSIEASTASMESSLERANTKAEQTSRTIGTKMVASMSSAAVQTRDLASALLGITGGAIAKGFKVSILGPFGMLFKLIEPLVSILVDTFAPAFETFGALIKNQLAPLSFLFETMAQQLAPLVSKLLSPMVAMMEMAAVQFGTLMADVLKADGPLGALVGTFMDLMPIALEIVGALTTLGQRLFPVIIQMVLQLVPIVMELVEVFGKQFVKIIQILGDVWASVGPELVKTFVLLLEALLPLLPPLLELAAVLLKEVFAPATVELIKWFAAFITDTIVPGVQLLIDVAVPFIKDISTRIADFFGNFGKYAKQFDVLFIQPIGVLIDWLIDKARLILSALGLDDIGSKAKGVFDQMMAGFGIMFDALKSPINEYIIKPLNKLLAFDLPGVGPLVDFIPGISKIPLLAEGAALTNVPSIVGEAGPEMVIPLTRENVKTVLEPILPSVELPGMTDAVMWLRRIHQVLSGTVRVEDVNPTAVGQAERAQERDDLGSAVGLIGLVGGM